MVLDATGLPISTAVNNQTNPDVVAFGGGMLVTWQDGPQRQ